MANIYPFDGATSHYLMPNPYGFPMAWVNLLFQLCHACLSVGFFSALFHGEIPNIDFINPPLKIPRDIPMFHGFNRIQWILLLKKNKLKKWIWSIQLGSMDLNSIVLKGSMVIQLVRTKTIQKEPTFPCLENKKQTIFHTQIPEEKTHVPYVPSGKLT